jgi:hypothetical protein
MATVVRSGLRLDNDRNAGRGDRYRVDVSPALPGQRVTQPPALRPQRRERALDLVFRASADSTAKRAKASGERRSPARRPSGAAGRRAAPLPCSRQGVRAAQPSRCPPPPGRRAKDAGTAVDARSSTRGLAPPGSSAGSDAWAISPRSASPTAAVSHPGCLPGGSNVAWRIASRAVEPCFQSRCPPRRASHSDAHRLPDRCERHC